MLTLQHFLLRAQVLALYRDAIRASRSTSYTLQTNCQLHVRVEAHIRTTETRLVVAFAAIEDPTTRKETVAWIRSEFERHRNETDIVSNTSFRTCIVLLLLIEP